MSHIAEEYAKSLGTRIGRPEISDHFFPIAFDKYITLQTTKKFESRNYSFWPLAVSILKKHLGDIKIVQLGTQEDPACENVDLSLKGLTSFKNLFYIIRNSSLHVGIDSVGVHIAAALDIPCVGLYSNMLPSQSGPLWHDNSKFICIESDKKGNKPSYESQENPKTINTIKPELIASSILDLLEISHDLNSYVTVNTGDHYSNEIMEIVPNFMPPPGHRPSLVANLRCDYELDEKTLPHWLQHRTNLMISQALPLGLIGSFRENIAALTVFLGDKSITPDYIKALNKLNLRLSLICSDKSRLPDLRLAFFDWMVEEHKKPLKKDIDFSSEICDNTYYHSNKTLISQEKEYYSKAAWKEGIEKTEDHQKIIDTDDFWEEVEHLNIYNYAKKKKDKHRRKPHPTGR